jgi:hypothetical protein
MHLAGEDGHAKSLNLCVKCRIASEDSTSGLIPAPRESGAVAGKLTRERSLDHKSAYGIVCVTGA